MNPQPHLRFRLSIHYSSPRKHTHNTHGPLDLRTSLLSTRVQNFFIIFIGGFFGYLIPKDFTLYGARGLFRSCRSTICWRVRPLILPNLTLFDDRLLWCVRSPCPPPHESLTLPRLGRFPLILHLTSVEPVLQEGGKSGLKKTECSKKMMPKLTGPTKTSAPFSS